MLTTQELGWTKEFIDALNVALGPDRLQADDINLIDCNGDNVAVVGWDSDVQQYVLKVAPRL